MEHISSWFVLMMLVYWAKNICHKEKHKEVGLEVNTET
jgi:hypothetical protein